jgi:hypothetical protein
MKPCEVCNQPARFGVIDMTEENAEPHALCARCLNAYAAAVVTDEAERN